MLGEHVICDCAAILDVGPDGLRLKDMATVPDDLALKLIDESRRVRETMNAFADKQQAAARARQMRADSCGRAYARNMELLFAAIAGAAIMVEERHKRDRYLVRLRSIAKSLASDLDRRICAAIGHDEPHDSEGALLDGGPVAEGVVRLLQDMAKVVTDETAE